MECNQYFLSVPATQFVGRHIGSLLEQQKQDSHIYQKTGSLPLIFLEKPELSPQKQQSLKWGTVKKVWKSRCVMDVKMNTVSNYVSL